LAYRELRSLPARGTMRRMNDMPSYADWIGRTTRQDDVIAAAPVRALSATLDRDVWQHEQLKARGRWDRGGHARRTAACAAAARRA